MKRFCLLLILLLSSAASAFAGAKEDAARIGRDIAPFLNGSTPILVHLNLDQMDIEAFITFTSDLLKQGGYPDADIQQFALVVRAGKGFVQHFKDLGIHDIYATGDINISMSAAQSLSLIAPRELDAPREDRPANLGVGIAGPLIFPLAADAKESAILHELEQYRSGLGKDIVIEKIGNAIVVAPSAILEQAKNAPEAKSSPPPDLTRAIESVGSHMFDIVFIPTEDMRKVFEQLMPTLPPELGGGSTTLLTRGVLFEVATLKAPPDPMLDVRIQADSPDHAQALLALWEKATVLIRKQAAADIKGPDAQADQEMLDGILKLFQPKVEGEQVVLKLDSAQLVQWGKILVPSIERAQQQALRAQSASHVRQLLLAAAQYCSAQNDHWPAALDHETLGKYNLEEDTLINPRFPDRSPGYIYVKPPTNWSKTPRTTIVVYESVPDHTDGLNAGYADGHVEYLKIDEFNKQLKGQQDKLP